MQANQRRVTMSWEGGLAFEGRGASDTSSTLDGDSVAGASPMETLLLACGGCSAADVVTILEKMRVELQSLELTVTGTRRDDDPKRYVAIHFRYEIQGIGLDEPKARRAIDLSLDKYCSVIHSLAPDLDVAYELVLG